MKPRRFCVFVLVLLFGGVSDLLPNVEYLHRLTFEFSLSINSSAAQHMLLAGHKGAAAKQQGEDGSTSVTPPRDERLAGHQTGVGTNEGNSSATPHVRLAEGAAAKQRQERLSGHQAEDINEKENEETQASETEPLLPKGSLAVEENTGTTTQQRGDVSTSLTPPGHQNEGVTGRSGENEGARGGGGPGPNIQHEEGGDVVQNNTGPCIFEVEATSKMAHDEFTPKMFSIGPIHRNSTLTNKHSLVKDRHVDDFSTRVGGDITATFMNFLRENEWRIRNSYASDLSDIESKELITIISRDASFFIEIMLKSHEAAQVDFLRKLEVKLKVIMDLLLLENQIPFFVNLKLWDLCVGGSNGNLTAHQFFRFFAEFFEVKEDVFAEFSEAKAHQANNACHLLDLRRLMEIGWTSKNRTTREHVQAASATKLTNYGVKFQSNQGSACTFEFSNHLCRAPCLKIPQLYIEGGWESRVANMIAFEDYYYYNNMEAKMICQLIYLISYLVQNFDDMEVLMEHKIIIVEAPETESAYETLKRVSKGLNSPYVRPVICEEIDKVANECNICKVELHTNFYNSIPQISQGILKSSVESCEHLGRTLLNWAEEHCHCCGIQQNCAGGCWHCF